MSQTMEVARIVPATETQVINSSAGASASAIGPLEFTPAQVQLLKDTICKGATDDELKLFLEVCRAKKLDPFAKQIHPVKRWDNALGREVMSYQTGIDGFRLIALRTGQYIGQDEPLWCGDDGKWTDVWLSSKPPMAARATVHRKGFIKPITRIALFREYVQTKKDGSPNAMWSKMPANQLHKCAEALAFRAAFPEELSGFYATEEMGQADNQAPLSDGIDTGGHKHGTRAAASHVADQKLAEHPAQNEMVRVLMPDGSIGNARKAELGAMFPQGYTANADGTIKPSQVSQPTPQASSAGDPPLLLELFNRITKGRDETNLVFEELRREAAELGSDQGLEAVAMIMSRHGAEKVDDFKTRGAVKSCIRDLFKLNQRLNEPPQSNDDDEPMDGGRA